MGQSNFIRVRIYEHNHVEVVHAVLAAVRFPAYLLYYSTTAVYSRVQFEFQLLSRPGGIEAGTDSLQQQQRVENPNLNKYLRGRESRKMLPGPCTCTYVHYWAQIAHLIQQQKFVYILYARTLMLSELCQMEWMNERTNEHIFTWSQLGLGYFFLSLLFACSSCSYKREVETTVSGISRPKLSQLLITFKLNNGPKLYTRQRRRKGGREGRKENYYIGT